MAARVTKKVDAAAAEEECAVKRQSWIAAMFAAACLSLTHSIGRLLAWLMWRSWKSIYSHRRHLADSSIRITKQTPSLFVSLKVHKLKMFPMHCSTRITAGGVES